MIAQNTYAVTDTDRNAYNTGEFTEANFKTIRFFLHSVMGANLVALLSVFSPEGIEIGCTVHHAKTGDPFIPRPFLPN